MHRSYSTALYYAANYLNNYCGCFENYIRSKKNHHWNDWLSLFLNKTGNKDITPTPSNTNNEFHENASEDEVIWFNVVPAWIATNDGGATPIERKHRKNMTVGRVGINEVNNCVRSKYELYDIMLSLQIQWLCYVQILKKFSKLLSYQEMFQPRRVQQGRL